MNQQKTRNHAVNRNGRYPFVWIAVCILAFLLLLIQPPVQASLKKSSMALSSQSLADAYQASAELSSIATSTHTEHDNFRDAVLDYFNEDYRSAYKLFRPLAEKGDSSAEYYLALMYDEGRGVEQDAREAVNWYTRAAQQGHMDAQYNLGVAYASGMGVGSDMGQAVAWWERAAQRGSVDAQFNLGLVYYIGKGSIEVDLKSALNWWRKAAGHGDAIAQFQLGMMYATGKGTEQDLCTAGRLWRYAATQGHDEAIMAFQDLSTNLPSLSGCWDLRVDSRN